MMKATPSSSGKPSRDGLELTTMGKVETPRAHKGLRPDPTAARNGMILCVLPGGVKIDDAGHCRKSKPQKESFDQG
jgi:hypothetical protein